MTCDMTIYRREQRSKCTVPAILYSIEFENSIYCLEYNFTIHLVCHSKWMLFWYAGTYGSKVKRNLGRTLRVQRYLFKGETKVHPISYVAVLLVSGLA